MWDLHFQILKFWYPNSFVTQGRILKNSLLVIEEDLAVSLMFRLLFKPLFHDVSLIGRVLSFLFRLSRIFLGVIAYLGVSVIFTSISLLWFLTPFLLLVSLISQFIDLPFFFSLLKSLSDLSWIFIFGLGLFIYKLGEPTKKIWQIKSPVELWEASKFKQKDLSFKSLLENDEVLDLLRSLEVRNDIFNFLKQQKIEFNETFSKKILDLTKYTNAEFLTSGYFFIIALTEFPQIEKELAKLELKIGDFKQALIFIEHKRKHWRKVFIWDEDFAVRHLKGVNRGWFGVPTPNLDKHSIDLTHQATIDYIPEFIGRQSVVNETINILSQDNIKNVLLVGNPGSGKSALVKYLAKLVIRGDAKESITTKRVVQLDLIRLLEDVENEGDIASKINLIFDEVKTDENIIIFLDEIQNLPYPNLILPFLEKGRFQFIASTDPESFSNIIEKNEAMLRLFYKIELHSATLEETVRILEEKSIDALKRQRIYLTYRAIKKIAELSARFIPERVLPDSALYILEECIASAQKDEVTTQIVNTVFESRANIPIGELDSSQKQVLLDLEKVIHQKMIDQEEPVKKVSDVLRRAAADLRDQNRPIGSFLFVGPSGVGKTELSKTLSEIYFKKRNVFFRFDMSEYQTKDAVGRLIGTVDNPGQLTEIVLHNPYCLILLDEFEKASPEILNLFLQVLEDGRLTDASSKHIDFTNTIIIATSNTASLIIAEGLNLGKSIGELDSQVKYELLKVFKPELLNRFDEVVIFKTLSQEDLEKIASKKLEDLKNHLKEKGYFIEFEQVLVSELAKIGFDPSFGARPLRRLIQDTLEANLSKMILDGSLKKGENLQVGVNLLNPNL